MPASQTADVEQFFSRVLPDRAFCRNLDTWQKASIYKNKIPIGCVLKRLLFQKMWIEQLGYFEKSHSLFTPKYLLQLLVAHYYLFVLGILVGEKHACMRSNSTKIQGASRGDCKIQLELIDIEGILSVGNANHTLVNISIFTQTILNNLQR